MPSIIFDLIATYYTLPPRAHIPEHDDVLTLHTSTITLQCTRRALKHIVEQRIHKDAMSLDAVLQLFRDIDTVLTEQRYTILTQNNAPDILLVQRPDDAPSGIVLVLEVVHIAPHTYLLKTGFYRAASKIKKVISRHSSAPHQQK